MVFVVFDEDLFGLDATLCVLDEGTSRSGDRSGGVLKIGNV
jgi:hypothetical protein